MRSICLSLIICLFFPPAGSWAFNDDTTHPELTMRAILPSNSNIDNYLKENLKIDKGVKEYILEKTIQDWIKYGAKMEDAEDICRASNHFHNPNLPWGESGLTDTSWLANLYCIEFSDYRHDALISDITWATGYLSMNPDNFYVNILDKNEWDWASAREYFYTYLTGADGKTRRESLAKSMRALGQVAHMLQDMTVPAHVRNDFSPGAFKI
ncbi:MAG: hypothetical protein WA081_10785 [Desulfosalsimonadaceae bacterium]